MQVVVQHIPPAPFGGDGATERILAGKLSLIIQGLRTGSGGKADSGHHHQQTAPEPA